MKLNKTKIVPLIVIGLIASGLTHAVEVFPIIKEIKRETPRENFITVKSIYRNKDSVEENKTEKKTYEFVSLDLYQITNPGDTQENLVKALGSEDASLVFSPTKIVIPYGEERKVRIMPLKPVEKETVYRLRVRPTYPEEEIDKSKIRFAIGYDILVRYLPDGKRTQALAISCSGNNWTLTATGNVRSELQDLVIDGRKDKNIFNVYPSHQRTLKVNKDLTFTMDGKLYTYEMCQRRE